MAISRYAGWFRAVEYAYGWGDTPPPALQVISGPNATGSGTLVLAFGATQTSDGIMVSPLNTNASIIVGGDSGMETVTPSAVSASTPLVYGSSTVTATFSNLHGNGDSIRSGTVGLQEALNAASAYGGGAVVVDAGWVALGGTSAMVTGATVPAGVWIVDNRGAGGGSGAALRTQAVLTNAQILTLSSTAVQILPAPGAGFFYNILKATLVNENAGTAYAAGGVITVGYGPSTSLTQALSGTIATTFLTSPTVTQVIQLAGANLASTTEALYDNQPIFINNATANYTTGAGTLRVSLVYTIEAK